MGEEGGRELALATCLRIVPCRVLPVPAFLRTLLQGMSLRVLLQLLEVKALAKTYRNNMELRLCAPLQVRRKPKIAKGARDFMPDQMAIREVRAVRGL